MNTKSISVSLALLTSLMLGGCASTLPSQSGYQDARVDLDRQSHAMSERMARR